MKLKKLVLKKEVISLLSENSLKQIKGGTGSGQACASTNPQMCLNTQPTVQYVTCGESCGLTCDTPYHHCDMPTINDSCFSFCNDHPCNDY
ncbi:MULTISPECIES: class I lanthipeptide [Parabacteroides]|uniref:class I lanthipeptide n=1 Tax=Parabacteroides TaxID=375288 RepID=UPI00331533FE